MYYGPLAMTMQLDENRRSFVIGLGAATSMAIAGCTDGGTESTPTPGGSTMTESPTPTMTETATPTAAPMGSVRVAHFSPNAPNVDVYLNGEAVLEDVSYGAVSAYLDVQAGEHEVRITPAGDEGTTVFEGPITVEADLAYTVAATGEVGGEADREFAPRVLQDDVSSPGDDEARVTLLHASPDAPAVDITVAANGDALYDGVSFGQSGTVTVPAGSYTLQVRGATDSNDGDVVAQFDVNLDGGTAYTAFASGYLSPDDEPGDTAFALAVTNDTDGEGGAVMIEPSMPEMNPARVRVAHLSPNAPEVDVLLNGSTVLENVPYGAVSNFLDVPAGEHTLALTPSGDPSTTVLEGTVTVESGMAYTIAATGEVGRDADKNLAPAILQNDLSEPADDEARLSLLHASPDAPAVDITLASNGNALFDGVSYGQSGTVTVPAGSYTLHVRGDTGSNDGDIVASFDVELEGGTAYSAFASGYLTPDDEPGDEPFGLTVTADTDGMGGASTLSAGPAPGRVRVAHLSPNAPNVDVYVNDTVVLDDVPFGAVSSYLYVPPGEQTVKITAAGAPDTVVFEGPVQVASNAEYTIAATGEIGDQADEEFAPLILGDDVSAPDGDSARVRLVHTSPDAPAVDVTLESNGDVLFDGVPYGANGSLTVPAGSYTLQVRGDTDANDGAVVASFDLDLQGGTAYTAFASGYLSPDDEPGDEPFGLTVTVDSDGQGGASTVSPN
jgi:hypothetical protein